MLCIIACILALSLQSAQGASLPKPLAHQISPSQLIAAMNTLRVGQGHSPLIEHPTISAVAQGTADIMAASLLSWHIGDVSGRIAATGYGAGKKVWATENFAIASDSATIDQIMLMWDDYDHMLPATNGYYCHVGAGTATASNGMTYFILQAAYVSGEACGSPQPIPTAGVGTPQPGVPGVIVPVQLATPDANGIITHIVRSGQSYWAIAVAYKITIKDLLAWNNLPESYKIQPGDKLIILSPSATNYQTPTPLGFVRLSTVDSNGRLWHTVEAYQYLSSISSAYGVSVSQILQLNNMSIDTPLQIGQRLLIQGPLQTATPTPVPLTPLQKLTLAPDGRYYHTVAEGQNLTWIANYYGIPLPELLAWNGLKLSSLLYAGDRLLLQVTPPATPTFTPLPPTSTPSPTPSPTASPTLRPTTPPALSPSPQPSPTPQRSSFLSENGQYLWFLLLLPVAGIVVFFVLQTQKEIKKNRDI